MQLLHDESGCLLRGASQGNRLGTIEGARGHTLLWMSLAVGLLSGCGGSDALIMPSYAPERMAQEAMAEYDTNHDGYLDAKELERCPALKHAVEAIDKNGDKRLSTDEIAEQIRMFTESQVAAAPRSLPLPKSPSYWQIPLLMTSA